MQEAIIAIIITIPKPSLFSLSGTGTFIPKKLDITVGIAMIIVIAAKNFMTIFWLFEIIEENVSANRESI